MDGTHDAADATDRSSRWRARRCPLVVGMALAVVALAACDTGDGKTLQPTVPGATIAPTTPITVASVAIATLPAEATSAPASTQAPLPTADPDAAFTIFGPWIDGAPIQPLHTCDDADLSPAISWTGVPDGTAELAFAMVDESAVERGRPFVHWALAGVDPDDITLLEGDVPLGAIQGLNFFGEIGYGGPCPPPGDDAHLYRITVYALNQQVELADGTPATDLIDFVEEVAIGAADLTGTYQR